eukprot:PLAT1623.1.p1 GENE.PLAT1623.1~~PLAT1623.1.p1  ORF type:complete len:869 (-),score=364.01 PLAT1623.1:83-2689(-)
MLDSVFGRRSSNGSKLSKEEIEQVAAAAAAATGGRASRGSRSGKLITGGRRDSSASSAFGVGGARRRGSSAPGARYALTGEDGRLAPSERFKAMKARERRRSLVAAQPRKLVVLTKAAAREEEARTWVIMPNSRLRRMWDAVTATFVLYLCFSIPFSLGLSWSGGSAFETFNTILDWYFPFDILLNFRTAYVQDGEIISEPSLIWRHYVRTWFPIDLIGSIPFELFAGVFSEAERKSIKVAKILRVPKLLRVARMVKYLRQYSKYMNLVKTVSGLIFLFHVAGCAWALHLEETGRVPSWIDPTDKWGIYLHSLHACVLALMGVGGLSDEVDGGGSDSWLSELPSSQVFSIVTTVLGAICVAAITAHYVLMLTQNTSGYQRFRHRIERVKQEMQRYHIPLELQSRIRSVYDYLWIHQKRGGVSFLFQEADLSQSLRRELATHLASEYFNLHEVELFAGTSSDFQAAIVMRLRTSVFVPNDFVYRRADFGNEMYFLSSGQCDRLRDAAEGDDTAEEQLFKVGELHEGDFFGEVSILTDCPRSESVRAQEWCELNVLSKEDLFDVLDRFPGYAAKMTTIALRRQFTDLSARRRRGERAGSVTARIDKLQSAETTFGRRFRAATHTPDSDSDKVEGRAPRSASSSGLEMASLRPAVSLSAARSVSATASGSGTSRLSPVSIKVDLVTPSSLAVPAASSGERRPSTLASDRRHALSAAPGGDDARRTSAVGAAAASAGYSMAPTDADSEEDSEEDLAKSSEEEDEAEDTYSDSDFAGLRRESTDKPATVESLFAIPQSMLKGSGAVSSAEKERQRQRDRQRLQRLELKMERVLYLLEHLNGRSRGVHVDDDIIDEEDEDSVEGHDEAGEEEEE